MKDLMKLAILVFLCFMLLTGCIEARLHITVNRDGSADVEYKMGLDSTLAAISPEEQSPFKDVEMSLRNEEYIISPYNENGYAGIIARKHIEDLSELRTNIGMGFNSQGGGEENPFNTINFSVDNGFFYDTYTVDGYVDFTDILPEGQDEDEFSRKITEAFLSKAKVDFVLTLPIEPEMDNATSKADSNKTLIWNLVPGKKNDILLKVKVWNVVNIAITIGAVILLIIISLFVILRKRASQGTVP